jgi:hypothetical protein
VGRAALCAGLAAALVALPALSAETVVMTATDPDGAAITFAFDKDASPPTLFLRTEAAGVAYSALSIYVDKSTTPTYRHIFGTSECAFPGGGPSRCTVTIPKGDRAYGDIVAIFKAGKEARITVDHGSAVAMDHTASLIGFTKAFDE